MTARRRTHNKRTVNRNRAWKQTQHTWALTVPATLLLLAVVVVGVMYMVMYHSCETIQEEIAHEEARQQRLMRDFSCENNKWATLTAAPRLHAALRANGIAMSQARQSQRISRATYYARLRQSTGTQTGSSALAVRR